MRQLLIWLDDAAVGCGARVVLEVSQGRDYAHLLHVPTLSHVKMPLRELEDQVRRGMAREVPIWRGVVRRIDQRRRDFDRYGFRYPGAFVKEALEAIRADRRREGH